jgi:nickel-dependent lactate racemase
MGLIFQGSGSNSSSSSSSSSSSRVTMTRLMKLRSQSHDCPRTEIEVTLLCASGTHEDRERQDRESKIGSSVSNRRIIIGR